MRKKQGYFLVIAGIVIAIVVVTIFSFNTTSNAQAAAQLKRVVIAAAQVKTIPKTVAAIGKIISPNTISINAQQAGMIQAIYFNPGDTVTKNQLLMQIDNANQDATYQQQLANYQQANAEYTRYLNMQKSYVEAVSKEILDEKLAAMKVALAQLNAAKVNLDETQIRAPFAGIITAPQSVQNGSNTPLDSQAETQIAVGSYLNVGDAVAMLIDPNNLEVQYQIPQLYSAEIKIGQTVLVTTTAFPDVTFHAHVNYISPIVLQTGLVYIVRAVLEDNDHRLSPGMGVIAAQVIEPNRQILSVPGLSLIPSFTGYNVYIVQDGKVRLLPVTIGERFGPDVAILSGLQRGQKFVVEGQEKVTPGSAVEILTK